ncbi:MAG: formiminotransferase-cyclodeaminase [Thermotogae bacterium]|nr:MAG: formiminotransferase-cyclodeaminase [Thermotogota bacterium]
MDIGKLPIGDFCKELGAPTPTPGGGAVGAVVASFAAALAKMVAGLTLGKSGYEEYEPEMEKIVEEMEERIQKLQELADEDVAAFDAVMAAFKLPKGEERKAAIQKALKRAAEVPFEVARCARSILSELEPLAEWGNKNAISDVASSAHLAMAAFKIALENVNINLKSIKDEKFVKTMNEETKELRSQIEGSYSRILKLVEERP